MRLSDLPRSSHDPDRLDREMEAENDRLRVQQRCALNAPWGDTRIAAEATAEFWAQQRELLAAT
jgi:hypothetical protein